MLCLLVFRFTFSALYLLEDGGMGTPMKNQNSLIGSMVAKYAQLFDHLAATRWIGLSSPGLGFRLGTWSHPPTVARWIVFTHESL